MTLLEFVMVSELGRPKGRDYPCPAETHHSPSVFLYDPHPRYKDRWKCVRCGTRGDVFDLLKLLHPGDTYDARLARLARHRERLEAGQEPDETGYSSSPVGSRRRAACDDPECLADVCRATRGLAPATEAELFLWFFKTLLREHKQVGGRHQLAEVDGIDGDSTESGQEEVTCPRGSNRPPMALNPGSCLPDKKKPHSHSRPA